MAATADGYDPASGTVPDDGDLTLTLRSNVVSGTITDQAGDPVAGARVFVDGQSTWVRTDERGTYALPGVPEQGTLIAKLAGYRLAEIPLDGSATKDVALEPFEARALYAPGAVFEGAGRLDDMLRLIDRTEANAMVIDVKETGGYLYYETNLPEAKRLRCRSAADLRAGEAAAAPQGARHLHHRAHGGHEGQHGRRDATRAGGAQRGHRRPVA